MKLGKILRVILIVAVVLISLIIGFTYAITKDPYRIIESKFGKILPNSAEIVEYSYNGYFEAKVFFEERELSNTIHKLEDIRSIGRIDSRFDTIPYNYKPNWWDLNDKNIVIAFLSAERGPKGIGGVSKLTVWKSAVIVKQNDGKHYLYLDFVLPPADVVIGYLKNYSK